nr:hypothetical protein [Akkermansiaceae bacterium]
MPIANDPPTLANVQGAIGAMRTAMADILAKEETLDAERGAKSLEARLEHSRREGAEAARDAARLAEVAEHRRRAAERVEAELAARHAWIHNAHQNARNALASKLEAKRDRKVGSLQGSIFADRQVRQKQLTRATEEHKRLKSALAKDTAELLDLRETVCKALRSFLPVLRPMFQGRRVALAETAAEMSPSELREEAGEHLAALRTHVEVIARQPVALVFRWLPLSAVMGVIAVGFIAVAWGSPGGFAGIRVELLLTEAAVFALWLVGLLLAYTGSRGAAQEMATVRSLIHAAEQSSSARLEALTAQFEREKFEQGQNLSSTFQGASSAIQTALRQGLRELDQKHARLTPRLERLRQRKLARVEREHQTMLAAAQAEVDAAAARRKQALHAFTAGLEESKAREIADTLATPWRQQVLAPAAGLAALEQSTAALFPPFTRAYCTGWEPPAATPCGVRIGVLRCDLTVMAGRQPNDPVLALPSPAAFTVPFALGFPNHGSLLLETDGDTTPATRALATAALRLIASMPVGRAAFLFIDPVGLGRDFA